MSRATIAVVLAAGEGTRMKSATAKVLHPVAGRSMLGHVMAAIECAGISRIAVVVGPDHTDVAAEVRRHAAAAPVFVQAQRRGTAHAVLAARQALEDGSDVVVLYGDTPLIQPDAILALTNALERGAAVAVLGFEAANPTGYGRLVLEDGQLARIVEEKEASASQKAITFCNGGLMALRGDTALSILDAIGNANAKGEFYLTDAVEIARARGLATAAEAIAEEDVHGVNDRVQLAMAESILQGRIRERVMREGATLIAPDTVFLSYDTRLGRDVVVEPSCWFGPGVTVEDGAVIHAFSHLEGAHVGAGVSVGPFARLRPGTRLGANAKVGNFVEIKAANIEDGAKISHLSYIGDASVGKETNIGAGTITCNYDGYFKSQTVIGAGVFVGSNSALVAPVSIGDGANIGAGSVITRDVPADALAVGRARQIEKAGWAKSYRAAKKALKAQTAKK